VTIGPLQLSFAPLAQTSSYAAGIRWWLSSSPTVCHKLDCCRN